MISEIFAPRPTNNSDRDLVVGTFRTGEVRRGKPVSLEHFRVTSDSADVIETLEELLGGTSSENDSDKESIQLYTEADSVDVQILSVDTGFSVWANSVLLRTCDGHRQTSGDHVGEVCPCAGKSMDDRKAFAKAGGCKPATRVTFRLAAAPELGIFQYRSSSWSLIQDIQPVEAKVDKAGGDPVNGRIRLEKVKTDKFDYTKPIVSLR